MFGHQCGKKSAWLLSLILLFTLTWTSTAFANTGESSLSSSNDNEKVDSQTVSVISETTFLYESKKEENPKAELSESVKMVGVIEDESWFKVIIGSEDYFVPLKDLKLIEKDEQKLQPDYPSLLKEETVDAKTILIPNDGSENKIEILETMILPSYEIDGNKMYIVGGNSYYIKKEIVDENIDTVEENPENSDSNSVQGDVVESKKETSPITENESSDTEKDLQPKESEEPSTATTLATSSALLDSPYFRVETQTPVYDNSSGALVVIGYLSKGEEFKEEARYGKNWHQIQFGTKNGFVYTGDTTPISKSEYSPSNIASAMTTTGYFTAQVNAQVYDNSRTGQGLVQFATIKAGVSYPYTGMLGTNWYQVKVNGLVGYVYSGDVTPNFKPSHSYFKVLKDSLPIYKAGLEKVGSLDKGDIYYRVGQMGPNWHTIQFGTGYAYVLLHDTAIAKNVKLYNLDTTREPIAGYLEMMEPTVVYDNNRPGGGLVPFLALDQGTVYPYIKTYGNWYEIQVGNLIGYVHKSSVERVPPADSPYYVALEDAPVYQSINNAFEQVATLPKGNTILITGSYNESLYEIQFGNTIGYIKKRLVKKTFGDELTNVNQNTLSTGGYFQTTEDITVYDSTADGLVPFLTLEGGNIFNYVEDYGANWLKVQIGSRVGYIYKPSVQKVTPQYVTSETLAIYKDYTSAVDYRYQDQKVAFTSYGDVIGILEADDYVSKVITMDGKIGWTFSAYLDDSVTSKDWIVQDDRNLRSGPGTQYAVVGSVSANSMVKVLNYDIGQDTEYKHWYKIRQSNGQVGWMWGAKYSGSNKGLVIHAYDFSSLNRDHQNELTITTSIQSLSDITGAEINQFLDYKTRWRDDRSDNLLLGMGDVFVEAASQLGMNVMYLISHAALETGWGTSQIVNDKYNYFGIAAYDSDPYGNAYDFGSKENGIKEGARWIYNNYTTKGQDTLDSMRNNNGSHQYATDEAWHLKIANIAKDLLAFVTNLR